MQVFSLINHHFTFLVVIQSIHLALFFLVFVPVITLGYEAALLTSRISYVSLSNLTKFLANPVTLLFLLVFFFGISVFLIAQDFFLKEFFFMKRNKISFSKTKLIFTSLQHTFNSVKRFKLTSFTSIWITMVAFNLPLLLFTTRTNLYLRYISNEVSSMIVWSVIILCYFVFSLVLFRKDLSLLKKHALFSLAQLLVLLIVYMIGIVMLLLLVSFLIPQTNSISAFIHVLTRFNNFFMVFLFLTSTLFHYALHTYTVTSSFNVENLYSQGMELEESKLKIKGSSIKLILVVLLLILTVDVYHSLGLIRNGSVLQSTSLNQINITSHRGYSLDAPENTLVSIEKAIEAFSDFVEFDVRVTSDNHFVLLHDDNLRRTTGLNKSITDLTLDAVRELDAGKWFRPEFEGINIPTLQEALEITKGRILVNLDLKLNDSQKHLIPNLVDMIDENDMQHQLIITSTCLPCLRVVKELNSNIKTGYITYRVTTALLNDADIDVMSVRASFVTQSMVDQIHQAGKQIFVWTVNTRSEIERMRNLNVNNIITSRPTYVKEVLFEISASRFILNLIRIILN